MAAAANVCAALKVNPTERVIDMAEERKRPSLHDHSSSVNPSSMRDGPSLHNRPSSLRDEKPRERKKPGDMKERHRGERVAMYQAQSTESRDMHGNQAGRSGRWCCATKRRSRTCRRGRSGN